MQKQDSSASLAAIQSPTFTGVRTDLLPYLENSTNFACKIGGSIGISQGFDAATATTKALALAYQSVVAQANALSFKNSFWGMSLIVLCLVPLPFVMRRPKPGQGRPQAAH